MLKPNMKVFSGGAFGKRLGHEGKVFMSGICALVRDPESSLAPLPDEDIVRKPSVIQEAGFHQTPNLLVL